MKKILIVDDDNELRSNLSVILEDLGYSLDTASSGDEAIKKAAKNDYSVVLLDLMMPGTSGMHVLDRLRRNAPRTKVIVITAFAGIDTAVEAVKKGASDYISKPFKIHDLDLALKKTLEEARFDLDLKKMHLDDTLGSLSNHIRRNIIKLLAVNKKMRLMQLTRALDIEDHTKVIFHLRMLRESGIISQEDKSYILTKEGKKVRDALRIIESHIKH